MRSEIRDSTIQNLLERVRKRNYTKYLIWHASGEASRLHQCRGPLRLSCHRADRPQRCGKTTILGAAGLIYDSVPPRRFFAKSGTYDGRMRGWKIEYELIDKSRQGSPSINRTASYLQYCRNRDAVNLLLFEVGWQVQMDEVWVVFVKPQVQLQRLCVRDGMTEAEGKHRISLQGDLNEKATQADVCIDNNGAEEATFLQVKEQWL